MMRLSLQMARMALAVAWLLGPSTVLAQAYGDAAKGLRSKKVGSGQSTLPRSCTQSIDCLDGYRCTDKSDGHVLQDQEKCSRSGQGCICSNAIAPPSGPPPVGSRPSQDPNDPVRHKKPQPVDDDPPSVVKYSHNIGMRGTGRPEWVVHHEIEIAGKQKSWQRNWTHYHARGDANMWNDESVNHLAHIDGENPPTPLDEARKGNFNWEPHTDPNRPQADWTHDDMVEAHKDRGWNMAQGRDEAVELTSVHEWEVCQSVDNRPVPTGKYHPLAYAISAHKDNRQHCESFCEAMHDQTCYKACDSSGGCYCDGKFDLSINHCLTKMATKVCICSEEKHRDSGHEPGEKYNHSKIIHPRHHQEPAPPGRHDDRLKMKPKRGFRRKPSRRSQEEFEADRDGTHEQLAEKRAKRAQRRVERLRLHQEKIAAISAHHSAAAEEAQSRGQDQETLAQAARSAARLQNTQVHRTAEELVAQAKADFAYAMKVKQEL